MMYNIFDLLGPAIHNPMSNQEIAVGAGERTLVQLMQKRKLLRLEGRK